MENLKLFFIIKPPQQDFGKSSLSVSAGCGCSALTLRFLRAAVAKSEMFRDVPPQGAASKGLYITTLKSSSDT